MFMYMYMYSTCTVHVGMQIHMNSQVRAVAREGHSVGYEYRNTFPKVPNF